MKWISEISRFLVGGLFIFSGLIKVNDPVGTAIKLEEYFQVFAADFAPFFEIFVPIALPLSVFLCVLEVVLGVAVLLNYRMKLTSWVLLLMIVFFTFLTFYSAYFNKVTDCGCFGDAIKLTPWESFTKDIILVVLIGFIFIRKDKFKAFIAARSNDMIIVGVTAINLAIAIIAIQHLPFIDFRAYKIGTHIPSAMQPSGELKYAYIMEKDGDEFSFDQYPTDKSYEFKELLVLNPEVQPKITDYSIWNDEGEYTEASFEGNKLYIIIYNVKKADANEIEAINQLSASLGGQVEVAVLTASDYASFEAFRHEVQLAIPYYYADATVLKTIVRSNPGLWLMKDGTVKGKWHYNDVPSADEVLNLL